MSKTLLYLEDDDALAYVTARALKQRGFEVHHYANNNAATEALNVRSFQYALLDLKIGQDTSLELIQQIKQHSNIPIVIITGYATVRTAVLAMKLGAINFLSKPCSIEEIELALHDKTESHKLVNEDTIERPSLKNTEWEAIQKALDDNDGNISAAARQLKLHRRTLQRKLQKRHLDDEFGP